MARAEDGQGEEDALRGHRQDGRLNQSPENTEHLHDVPDVGDGGVLEHLIVRRAISAITFSRRHPMLNDNQVIKWVLIILLAVLVLPLVAMIGMMGIGATTGGGMMAHMGGMMSGSSGSMMMSGGAMGLSLLWMVLVAAALIVLIALLVRGTTHA
jgi:hypothetical protein